MCVCVCVIHFNLMLQRAPLHLRYSVSYVPRTKRKLTSSNSTRRQSSKENKAFHGERNKNEEENVTSGQQEPTKSCSSICPGKASKHPNSRTRPDGDHRKSTHCKDNVSKKARRAGGRVVLDGKSAVTSRGSGSGCQDVEHGEDRPKGNLKMLATEEERALSGSMSKGVSQDTNKVGEKFDERIAEIQEFQGTRNETGGQTQTMSAAQIAELNGNIVHAVSEDAELTIDLTGEDLNCSIAPLSAELVDETRSDICGESVSRVVGSIAFMGSGSGTVLSSHESVLCGLGQNSLNGDIAKPLPCINAFKTLSCGLRTHHFGYASSDGSQIVGESVVTDDVMKMISAPEVTIVPSFGVQLIYSADSVVSQNPICGVIQLPEAVAPMTSDTLTRTPAWSHGDVAANGVMNDADFQRLCEGNNVNAEKNFGGCFEQFVMPNIVEGITGRMSDEVSLSYALSLDATASGPLPCVFVAQGAGHQPRSSWSLPELSKDAEMVDWSLCYPVAAAELGMASVESISDERHMEPRQPEFICVSSSALSGSSMTPEVGELWSQGLYADRSGLVETVLGSRGEAWAVEARQAVEPTRAVKMCIVEPQAVKRKAENNWAVEPPREAKTSSYLESNTTKPSQTRQRVVEIETVTNAIVEPRAVEMQTVDLCVVECVPELWRAVEPRTTEPAQVQPTMMGPKAVKEGSMGTVAVALCSVDAITTSSCMVECSPAGQSQGVETKPKKLMLSKLHPLEEAYPVEPKAAKSVAVELQLAQSQTVDAYAAEESLVEPDDVEPDYVESDDVESDDVEPDDVQSDDVEPDDLEPDDVEPDDVALVLARTSPVEQLESAERKGTSVNCSTGEVRALTEDETSSVCLNSPPMVDSSLTVVPADLRSPCGTAGTGENQEETSVLQQNQHTVLEVESLDHVLENAILSNSKEQLLEQTVAEKFLLSNDNLTEFRGMSTNWSFSKGEEQLAPVSAKKDADSESVAGPEAADETRVEPKTVSTSTSSSGGNEAVHVSIEPEDISCEVEESEELVSLEEEECLVIDMMEQRPAAEEGEDVLAPSDDADSIQMSFDPPNNSYSHLSNGMLSSPHSEAVCCSLEATELLASAAEDISVSSDAVNHCLVDAGVVLLSDDGVLVSVTDDHVVVCVRDREPVNRDREPASGAEEGNSDESKQIGIAGEELPASDDSCEVPALESFNKIPCTDGLHRTQVSEACNAILVADDCSELPISDSCNRIAASDDCSWEVPISDCCNRIAASDDHSEVPTSDSCNRITASDDHSELSISDSYNRIAASYDCSKVPSSDSCNRIAASDDHSEIPTSDSYNRITALDDHSELPISDSYNRIAALDDHSKEPTSDSSNKIADSDDQSEVPASDSCNRIAVTVDCNSEVCISDSCTKRPVTDVCDKARVSITTPNLPISAVTEHTTKSNGDETASCVLMERPVQSQLLFDGIQVSNTTGEDLVSCVSNDIAVSNVAEKIPVAVVMDEGNLTNYSAGDFSISHPIPSIPNYLPIMDSDLTEDIPVSRTSSLENVPVCSSTLETAPFCASMCIESIVYPLAVSPLARGYSHHLAIESQVTSVGEDLEEEYLAQYVSTCGSDVSEVVPVSEDVSEAVPVSTDVSEVVPVSQEVSEVVSVSMDISEVFPVLLDVSETVPVSLDVYEGVPISLDVSEAVPVSQDLSEAVPVSQDVFEAVPVSEDVSEAVTLSQDVSEVVPLSKDVSEAVPISLDVSEVVPVLLDVSETVPVSLHVSEAVPVSLYVSEVVSVSTDISEVVPISQDLSEAVPVSQDVFDFVPVSQDVSEAVILSQDVSEVVPVSQDVSEAVPFSKDVSEAVPISLDVSEVVPVSQDNSAPGDIDFSAVETTWNGCNILDRISEQIAEKAATNCVEESLVTNKEFPPEFNDRKSAEAHSHQNFKLLDFENVGGNLQENRVPCCETKIIDSHVDPDDQELVDFLTGGDSVISCADKREKNEDMAEDDLALSQRLRGSGSVIAEGGECQDRFQSITSTTSSVSFSDTSSKESLDCAVSSGSQSLHLRSLDESTKEDGAEWQSRSCVSLEERIVLLNRGRDTVDDRGCGNHIERSILDDEMTVLNSSESCVGHVPVTSFRVEPLVANVKDVADTVSSDSPTNDVVGVSDEHAVICKCAVPGAFCDACCDNRESSDGVLGRSPGDVELGDESPVDII